MVSSVLWSAGRLPLGLRRKILPPRLSSPHYAAIGHDLPDIALTTVNPAFLNRSRQKTTASASVTRQFRHLRRFRLRCDQQYIPRTVLTGAMRTTDASHLDAVYAVLSSQAPSAIVVWHERESYLIGSAGVPQLMQKTRHIRDQFAASIKTRGTILVTH